MSAVSVAFLAMFWLQLAACRLFIIASPDMFWFSSVLFMMRALLSVVLMIVEVSMVDKLIVLAFTMLLLIVESLMLLSNDELFCSVVFVTALRSPVASRNVEFDTVVPLSVTLMSTLP